MNNLAIVWVICLVLAVVCGLTLAGAEGYQIYASLFGLSLYVMGRTHGGCPHKKTKGLK